jgi:hypothetical protein
MTATVRDRPATPEPTPGYLIAAGDLLRDSGIRLRPAVPPAEATKALARAMAATEPDSPHRLLLLAALRQRARTEKRRDGARPLPERAPPRGRWPGGSATRSSGGPPGRPGPCAWRR